ncbi:MAG: sulfatase-like hydrolase/transferase, partial [Opitutales bacterium]|nr:sulfatase-like hydrolase/transferase [Opitutales bacterium]
MLLKINLAIVLPMTLLTLQGCSRTGSLAANTTSAKPNIILIISDDHGYADLSVMGVLNDVSTPNLDRLAAQGARFTHA